MRNYPPALLDAFDDNRVAVRGMLRIDLGEGSFGLIKGRDAFTFEGVSYEPFPRGTVAVSALPSSSGMTAQGFTVTLAENAAAGVTPQVIAGFEAYDYIDRPVRIYDLFVDPDTLLPLADPVLQKRGYVTFAEHRERTRTGYQLILECEDRKIDLANRNGRIRSGEDQERRAPGDAIYMTAALAGRRNIKWGRS